MIHAQLFIHLVPWLRVHIWFFKYLTLNHTFHMNQWSLELKLSFKSYGQNTIVLLTHIGSVSQNLLSKFSLAKTPYTSCFHPLSESEISQFFLHIRTSRFHAFSLTFISKHDPNVLKHILSIPTSFTTLNTYVSQYYNHQNH